MNTDFNQFKKIELHGNVFNDTMYILINQLCYKCKIIFILQIIIMKPSFHSYKNIKLKNKKFFYIFINTFIIKFSKFLIYYIRFKLFYSFFQKFVFINAFVYFLDLKKN